MINGENIVQGTNKILRVTIVKLFAQVGLTGKLIPQVFDEVAAGPPVE
ncbi:hypothetical protein [Lewinella sp. W8]|nr:hypothetical protein [Lewinella sp. W8]MTB49894.1 hypothetical protein [Lewinella sp. W8]